MNVRISNSLDRMPPWPCNPEDYAQRRLFCAETADGREVEACSVSEQPKGARVNTKPALRVDDESPPCAGFLLKENRPELAVLRLFSWPWPDSMLHRSNRKLSTRGGTWSFATIGGNKLRMQSCEASIIGRSKRLCLCEGDSTRKK